MPFHILHSATPVSIGGFGGGKQSDQKNAYVAAFVWLYFALFNKEMYNDYKRWAQKDNMRSLAIRCHSRLSAVKYTIQKNVASVSGVLRSHRLPPAPLLECRSALALVVNCADHIVFSDSLTDVHSRISYTRAMSDWATCRGRDCSRYSHYGNFGRPSQILDSRAGMPRSVPTLGRCDRTYRSGAWVTRKPTPISSL